MTRTFLLATLLCWVVISACARPAPTFEQKRGDVLAYLRAFNEIDNTLSDAIASIRAPGPGAPGFNATVFNAGLDWFILAVDGALHRLGALKTPASAPETAGHLRGMTSFLEALRLTLDDLRRAVSSGNEAAEQYHLDRWRSLDAEAARVNRATEQLLSKYGIADHEAYYRFRGK